MRKVGLTTTERANIGTRLADYSASIHSRQAEEYDAMLSQRYPNAPKRYAVYKDVIDSGDLFDVMRVVGDSAEEERRRRAALEDAIARGDKVAEQAHGDVLNNITNTSRVNSITYGSRLALGSATDDRPNKDLVFFNSKEAAWSYLVRRARNYQRPKGKTRGELAAQHSELIRTINNAEYYGRLTASEADRRRRAADNAYFRYSRNMIDSGADWTDRVPRRKYTK